MKTNFLTLLSILCIALTACSPQNLTEEETTLEVVEKSVSFGSGEETKSIAVNSSNPNWIATSAVEGTGAGQWITLKQEGTQLVIKVAENTVSMERVAYVVISAGGEHAKVEVKQAAADVELTVDPVAIVFKKDGGERSIDIFSNGENWEVKKSEEIEWLEVKNYPAKGKVQIIVQPNTNQETTETVEERKTVLIASSGSKNIEINITQKGDEIFFLPYMAEKQSLGDLHKFEQENERFITNGVRNGLNFISEAKHMRAVQYQYKEGEYTWKQALIFGDEHLLSDKFIAYMKGEGFTVQFDRMKPFFGEEKRKIRFLRDGQEKRIVATAEFTRKYGYVVRFIMEGITEGVFSTWDELPTRNLDMFDRKEVTIEYLKTWEEAQGVMDFLRIEPRYHNKIKGENASIVFTPKTQDQELQQTVWFLNVSQPGYGEKSHPDPKLVGTAHTRADAYNKKEKVYKSVGRKMFANPNFLTLMKREGYELFGQVDLEYGWAWFLKDGYQVVQIDGSYGPYAVFRFEEDPEFEAKLKN